MLGLLRLQNGMWYIEKHWTVRIHHVKDKANDRALKSKMNLKKTFELVKKFRKKNIITPIVLMGYYNPIHRFGINNFIKEIKKNKINGVIIVDLPPEEDN